MKLSEIKGERAIEVIADLIEPIADIASDPKCANLFRGEVKKGETPREAGLRNLKSKIPYLLREHKKSIIKVLSILNDLPAESLNMFSILKGVLDMFNDKELIELFTSAAQNVEETPPTDTSNQ